MAYCSNCGEKLVLSDENTLSSDLYEIDHYTHYCSACKLFWHLHFSGNDVVLSASGGSYVGMPISKDLLKDLEDKVAKLKAK